MPSEPVDKRSVIRVDHAISCCERNGVILLGHVQSILNQIEAQMSNVRSGGALALAFAPGPVFAPLVRVLNPAQYAAWIRGVAAIPGTLVVGSVVLLSYAELAPLIETRASYEMLSLIGKALGTLSQTLFRKRDTFCANCCREKALSQKHHRHRERAKILRRL